MPKTKKASKVKIKAKKASAKGGKKVAKKVAPKVKPVKVVKPVFKKVTLKQKDLNSKADKLISKGRERGFITYDEILKEFPKIEDDIIFLDDLYSKLVVAGIDVLEGGGMLQVDEEQIKKYSTYGTRSADAGYDSIQIYLKEIGQYPLISASMEKDLARKIQQGDMEAKNLLAKANLRLVVSRSE